MELGGNAVIENSGMSALWAMLGHFDKKSSKRLLLSGQVSSKAVVLYSPPL